MGLTGLADLHLLLQHIPLIDGDEHRIAPLLVTNHDIYFFFHPVPSEAKTEKNNMFLPFDCIVYI